MSVNKAILVGRLGADPELRTTGGGTSVVNMRMATSDRRKEGDQWVDHTEWHNITVWGRSAENVAKFCSKGKELFVEGRIQSRKYTDKTGVERYSTEIVADNIRFLGSKKDSNDSYQNSGGHSSSSSNDEHIPF
jgi:single-strand DNA-binding protein|tara:strand:+ start:509 stop:910 length:402 start_codon:yes stop_codon:yes gene_type:complete